MAAVGLMADLTLLRAGDTAPERDASLPRGLDGIALSFNISLE
jgi:hypothetical protein